MPSDSSKGGTEYLKRQQERKRQRLDAIISGKIPAQPAARSANTAGIAKVGQQVRGTAAGKSYSVGPSGTVVSTTIAPAAEQPDDKDGQDEGVWCPTCQLKIRKDDAIRHQHGTAHLLSQDSEIRPLDSLMLGHSNKGFKMLLMSGWDYEKGLGAQGQGRRHPIATQLRQDRRALGSANEPKKVVTHKIEEIENARKKMPSSSSNKPALKMQLSGEEHRRKARLESQERVAMMKYMKS